MILHIVLLKFRADISAKARAEIYQRLEALCTAMEGVSQFSAGPSNSPEGHEKGFKDGFRLYFDNKQTRMLYLKDSTHRAIGADLVSMLDGGIKGLLVFDLAV